MRVALLSAEYPPWPGGVGDYTRRLGQALAQRGHALAVLTGGAAGDTDPPVYDLGISSWDWRCWRAVIAALDRLRPDVLHIQYQTGAYGMHPAINLLPWRLWSLPGRPAIAVTAHDLLPPYLFPKAGPLRRWVTHRLLADADAVVVTNQEDFASVARTKRIEIGDWRLEIDIQSPISNLQLPVLIPIGSNIPVAPPVGYDRAAWRVQYGVAADETLIAYFGLVSRSKGLDLLLDALEQLPPGFRLLIVGGEATAPEDRAYATEIRRRIEEHGARRVIFAGHCAAAEVSAHLLAADLAALPFADGASFRRGSLLATLAHAVPTVTTRPTIDGLRPTTGDKETGRQGDGETRGQGDKETRRRGDKETRRRGDYPNLQSPISNLQSPDESATQNSKLKTQNSRLYRTGDRLTAPFVPPALVDGEHVLLVPPGDVAALAAAIRRLAADAALRDHLRGGGRALAAQFSWETIAARHEALYSALVG